ncbi:MAG TPA: alanine-zipper protein [Steroidobacteraceae bacterium]|nr:alanine-zipper protein [Steroidobacteraceae bacterium]
MNNTVANAVKAGAFALVLLSAAGCQSSKALDEVRAIAQKADQNAAAAQASANSASQSASTAANAATAAKSAADNAQSTANQALQVAQTAQLNVDTINERTDRMFRKTVAK